MNNIKAIIATNTSEKMTMSDCFVAWVIKSPRDVYRIKYLMTSITNLYDGAGIVNITIIPMMDLCVVDFAANCANHAFMKSFAVSFADSFLSDSDRMG